MEPKIQYARTSDGVSIAYWTAGEGRPLISLTPPALSHAELIWELFPHVLKPLAEKFHEVGYDSRGGGLSDRQAIDFSMEAMIRDLEAVVQRTGFETFALVAWNPGVPIAVTYAVAHPERISHLILIDGFATPADFEQNTAYRASVPLLETDLTLFTETFGQVLWGYQNPEFGRMFAAYMRSCSELEGFRAAWNSWATYDVATLLPQISIPTLVIYNKNSRWYPQAIGQRMAAAIPGARFVLIDDVTYASTPDLIEEFVFDGEVRTPRAGALGAHGAFRTILFTDLVGHTEMMSRLGDERGRDVLREHERITREVLKANGGTEVKTMGDGFMASFGSVTKAVECAVALQKAFAEHEGEALSVRVGLNAGEPIEEDGDLFGATVILASRIAAKAGGGEILVADTVRGLCSGKGFLFADRGEFVAKGFEEPVRVYEVSWRE
jgi:class 3 adenylate cyclase